MTISKTILYISLNKNLARIGRDNDFNSHVITNVCAPINDNDVLKKYVDSNVGGLKQDGVVSDSSNNIALFINTTNGELVFPLATKRYVDNFMYGVLQLIFRVHK